MSSRVPSPYSASSMTQIRTLLARSPLSLRSRRSSKAQAGPEPKAAVSRRCALQASAAQDQQLRCHRAPPGDAHPRRLGRTAHLRPHPGGKPQISDGNTHPADAPQPADIRTEQRPPQRDQQLFWRYGTGWPSARRTSW
jgi:hypothetical protein